MKPEDFNYVVKNNVCLFQKGPLSQGWGGFSGQNSKFVANLSVSTSKPNARYEFNCCEQWMMANKAALFNDNESLDRILQETNPKIQKEIGRAVRGFESGIWDQKKFKIVTMGNLFKFQQNKDLQDFLLGFHIQTIFCEAAPWDRIWGIGMGPEDEKSLDIYHWKGQNLLGQAIGVVRNILGS